ncbi:ABC transporter permease subunit [Mesorhizobium argentiipisi]|uniref:Ribose ABC transporter permease n=1 Tax=Mesorhizobium argentiipisi TaxID=3015175 RepID=A0ABU8KBN2_9HYPH
MIRYKINANLVILVILLTCAGLVSPYFWSVENIVNLVRVASLIGIVAVGMNLVIILGGIDLSVGSVVALTGTLAASLWTAGYPLPVVVMAPLAIAGAVGIVNGSLVAFLSYQPFVATLVTMTLFRGAGLVYSAGQPIYADYPPAFNFLARGNVAGIPAPALVLMAIVTLTWYVVRFRAVGRMIYMVGSNESAAYYGGVSVWRVKMFAYTYCAVLAGFAGLILTARMGSGEPGQAGVLLELDAIAAVVIGGSSLRSGSGSVWGALIGALVIGVLSNLFNLLGVAPEWQNVSKGAVILLAVTIAGGGPLWRSLTMRRPSNA